MPVGNLEENNHLPKWLLLSYKKPWDSIRRTLEQHGM